MPLPSADQIGGWTTTQLVKFIQDILDNRPPPVYPQLKVEQLTVTRMLNVEDELGFASSDWTVLGSTGAPGLTGGWVSWGSPYEAASYWRDPFGFVHLRGVLKSGTVGAAAFTLPPGWRPANQAGPFVVLSNNAAGRVDVNPDGTVVPQSPSSNASVVLDQITFKAA